MPDHYTANLDLRKRFDGLKVYVAIFGLGDSSLR